MSSQTKNYISQSLTPPKTPTSECELPIFHSWPEPETEPGTKPDKPSDLYFEFPWEYKVNHPTRDNEDFEARNQEVLLLHGPKQKYEHTREHPIPALDKEHDMLVEVEVVGLNPIDWKAPDYGFGLPQLPCISGRDFAGKVVKAPRSTSRFEIGEKVMAISTDYRDNRRSAFQQYAVVSDFNACKLPTGISAEEAAPLGVAFVAASIALGVCLGVDFLSLESKARGLDLLQIVRSLDRNLLPVDIRAECFDGIRVQDRAKKGDWIAIWGGSSASGCCAIQLAKLAGLRVIAVIDVARSGERMLKHGADLLVDRLDTKRAVNIIKNVTRGKLRFGLDTVGKESAGLLAEGMLKCEAKGNEGPQATQGHVVGLTGVPKKEEPGVAYHSVPIKLFHEAPVLGEGLKLWLEELLRYRILSTPDIEIAAGGLKGINSALDRLRDGSVNGPRIVVPLVMTTLR